VYNRTGTEVHTFAERLLAEWRQLYIKVEEEVAATEAAEAAAGTVCCFLRLCLPLRLRLRLCLCLCLFLCLCLYFSFCW